MIYLLRCSFLVSGLNKNKALINFLAFIKYIAVVFFCLIAIQSEVLVKELCKVGFQSNQESIIIKNITLV